MSVFMNIQYPINIKQQRVRRAYRKIGDLEMEEKGEEIQAIKEQRKPFVDEIRGQKVRLSRRIRELEEELRI
jgi:hypothetical protein